MGIGRTSADFRLIPFNSRIPRFPEFRAGIRPCPNEITYQHNITNVGEEDGVIPVSDSGIPELEPVPGIPKSVELDQSRVGLLCCVSIEFPELDGIDSGAELIPAMFNIAE